VFQLLFIYRLFTITICHVLYFSYTPDAGSCLLTNFSLFVFFSFACKTRQSLLFPCNLVFSLFAEMNKEAPLLTLSLQH